MSYSEAMAKHYYLKEFADKLDSKKPDKITIQHEINSLELKKQWLEEFLNTKSENVFGYFDIRFDFS
ncbi:hypothetical protein ACA604_16410 [Lactiplantibacillus pentosus]|uniref:hypothetical protein n=1 Tax=Lactiplantibacillus pentosus TaxID=1589 RepID=UPI003C2476CF